MNYFNYPTVTVLMPVYNGETYLKEAIESILNQTFPNFELLIINDGSTDQSSNIIQSFKDTRINFINNKKNLGLVQTLNQGLDLIKADYIIRMDQDDISLPIRFEKQIKFMEENPDIGICGTWLNVFRTTDNQTYVLEYPTEHEQIKRDMLKYCPVAHPSLILRKALLDKYNLRYDENYTYAEDYELWSRAINCFKFANIPDALLNYKVHTNNMGIKYQEQQKTVSEKIQINQIKRYFDTSEKETALYLNYIIPEEYKINNKADLILCKQLFLKLIKKNQEKCIFDILSFNKFIKQTWWNICIVNRPQFGFWIIQNYFSLKLIDFSIIASTLPKLLLRYLKNKIKHIFQKFVS